MTADALDTFVVVVFEWFALGLLWLFVAGVLLGLVQFIRRVLG